MKLTKSTQNNLKKVLLFVVMFLLSFFILPKSLLANGGGAGTPGMDCIDAFPFCSDDGYNFSNVSDGTVAPNGPNYGCLSSVPNPVWYYMEVATSGPIQLHLAQSTQPNGGGSGLDVDFAMWGPFNDVASGCTQVMGGGLSPLQCSYSASATETIGIGLPGGAGSGSSTPPNAIAGEVYIVLITNYNGGNGYITFEQTNLGPSSGSTDCSIVEPCNINGITAAASSCNPADNSFSISGEVSFTDPPENGQLIIEDCSGAILTFNAPFTSPTAFNFTGHDSDGGTCAISARFMDENGDLMCSRTSDPVQNPIGCTCQFTDLALASVTSSTLDCHGDCDGEITANVTGGEGVITFEWRDENGNIVAGTTHIATGLCAGNYSFLATDENGCGVTGAATIVNPPLEDASFTLTDFCVGENNAASNILQPGGSFDFNPPPTDEATIHPGTGTISNETGGTTYFVEYTTPNCQATSIETVTVNEDLTPYFIADTLIGCYPFTVNFTNLMPNNNAECLWDFGDGTTYQGCEDVSHTYTTQGLFDVTLNVASTGGCSGSYTIENYIDVRAIPDAKFIASPTKITNYNSTVHFFNQTIGADSYTWNFGDGIGVSNEENPTYNYNSNELHSDVEFIVTLVAQNEMGCTDTTQLVISYEEDVIFYVPNSFTPDHDNFNEVFTPIITAGVDPFKYSLFIYNRWGETLFESHDISRGWDGTYGGQLVKEGTYIWKIEFGLNNSTDDKQTHQGFVNVLR